MPSVTAQDRDVVVITDVVSWEHPVKKVFARYSVVLKKVELLRNKKYPVFYVDLPWDPQTSPNASQLNRLATELFLANGKNDYAIQSDGDGIRIEYKFDKPKKTLHEDIVSLAEAPVPK
jgi:hypothetical protein